MERFFQIRIILEALGHKQPPTPLKTDNATAVGFANSNMRQKKSKSWDMRYNWLRCRSTQKQLRIYWDKGKLNQLADYFTKHFPPKHHQDMRKQILHTMNHAGQDIGLSAKRTTIERVTEKVMCRLSERLRGCVDGQTVTTVTPESQMTDVIQSRTFTLLGH